MVMFWVTLLAISILLYVLLDGFDLGVGILFGLTRSETRRSAMLSAVAPIWDGNETWLVVTAVILWGAFPVAYAVLLSAFYLPLLMMLAGLILRGVAFEYRNKAERMRWLWNWSFIGGSVAAAFIQGLTVGRWSKGCQYLPSVRKHCKELFASTRETKAALAHRTRPARREDKRVGCNRRCVRDCLRRFGGFWTFIGRD
jgi:cytochrome d oxidase subunit CydB